ncbi:unnamed protein product [Rotaria sp. Silwood2]|nr:unnamed protein product [Rotaria sp. Silwood2]
MSSTPTTSVNPSSSRVQSASNVAKEETPIENNNATTEKTSRPPSALQKIQTDTSTAPVIATTDNGLSSDVPVAEKEEPILSDRPPSAAVKNDLIVNPILDSTNAEQKSSRPSSANPKIDESISHGYTINTTNSRQPSASRKDADSSATAPISSRPPSANPKTNELSSHGYTINTNSRPPSAKNNDTELTTAAPINSRPPSAKHNDTESTIAAPTNSRPPSASQKANESVINNSIAAPISSRPSSVSQNTDITRLSNSSNIVTSTNSRPPSANTKTDLVNTNNPTTPRIGSRPPSANPKIDLINTNNSTTPRTSSRPPSASQKQNETTTNDSDITQPFIGRPSSAAKRTPTDESKIMITLDANAAVNTPTENAPSSDENKPVEPISTTPRIGSASKNLQTSTTTENNS